MVNFQTLEDLTDNLYIDPPEGIKMAYPCILLERDRGDTKFADNSPYIFMQGYSLTVIHRDDEAGLALLVEVRALSRCVVNRHFVTDNLHHDVHSIFF